MLRAADGVGSDHASVLYPSAGAEPASPVAASPSAPAGGTTPDPVVTPPVVTPPAGDPPAADPKDPAAPAGEWKEYEPDATKTDEENAAAKEAHDATKPQPDPVLDVVPEDGKYLIQVPDGMSIDVQLLDAVAPEFKELGLTNRQAQKLAGKYGEIIAQRDEQALTEHNKAVAGWLEEAKKDPQMGGEKWAETERNASRFIGQHGSPQLKEMLDQSGYGNHPELIRIMAVAGSMIADDTPVTGSAPPAKAQDVVDVLYPNNRKG